MKKRLLSLLLCLLMVLAVFPAAAQAEEYVTVTFDANGGHFWDQPDNTIDTEQAKIGDTSTVMGRGAGTPKQEDHVFIGWYLTADGSGEAVDPWHYTPTYQRDTTFYAKWRLSAYTGSGSCGKNLTWSFDEASGWLTITGSGDMDDYRYNDQPWASKQQSIVAISLPDGLTSIGVCAFEDCTNLKSITIPNGVTSIGYAAFNNCSLSSLTLPDSLTTVGVYAFYGNCISEVTIPKNVTSIGAYAFFNIWDLRSFQVAQGNPAYASIDGVLFSSDKKTLVAYPNSKCTTYVIPEGVTHIGNDAFAGCMGLTSITIPKGVTHIGGSAFFGCGGLTSVTIPEGVTYIGVGAFGLCSHLESITIPDGVTSIEKDVCIGCYSLASMTIPKGVTSIGEEAFSGCHGLTSIIIPKGVTSIGREAFESCRGLTSITIPNSVNAIGHAAFSYCGALQDVYYQGTEAQKAQIEIGDENDSLLRASWHYDEQASSTPTPAEAAAKTVKVQAKKSLKLQAPKAKGNAYQWYVRANRNAAWQSLGKKGAKDKLSVKATMALDGYQYRCQITNASGVKYTDIYELYVYEQLKVKKQPKWGKKVLPGAKMPLTITAQGASSYQWVTRPNGSSPWTKIEGATGTSYVVDVQEGMAGRQYACQISGKAGTAQSKAAVVKIAPWPKVKFSKQPVLKKPVVPGSWVTLTVKAQNADTYQWYYRTSAKGAWILYSGATQPNLSFQVGAGTNGYQYKCTAKGRGGSVDSKPVTLKVVTP